MALGLFACPYAARAHSVPVDSTVRMFVKPEGQKLHLLVRMPMASIHDIDWPLQRPTAYLDLTRIDPFLRDAGTLWIADFLDVFEGSTKLAYPTVVSVRLSAEGDASFTTYDDALAHVTGPLIAQDSRMLSTQGMLDVYFDYAIQSDRARFSLHPRFDRFAIRVLTILRFQAADGSVRGFEYQGGDPGLIRLDPEWHQTAAKFAAMGFRYFVGSADHLLFLLCLVIPFRKLRDLIPIVGSFAAAHSITFVASALGMAPDVSWFPPLIVTLVAIGILYLAIDNVIGIGDGSGASARDRRWKAAFAFGLAHGFAFSFPLGASLQFAGSHLVTAVVAFNAGVQAAMLLAVALLVPSLSLLFRFVATERIGSIVISALAAHVGWHWLTTRVGLLWRYQFTPPALTAAFFADVLRWLMVAVAVAGVWWLGSLVLKSTRPRQLGH